MLKLTSFALVGHTDCKRYAECICVLESNCAFNTANVGGKAYVIVGSLKEITDLAEKLDLAAAEGYARGVKVCKLIAGARTANCAEVNVLLTASCCYLFHLFGVRDHLTFAKVDHTLGDRENRNAIGEARNYVIKIPIKTEAGNTADREICAFKSLFHLVNGVEFGSCGDGALEGEVLTGSACVCNDLAVKGRAYKTDLAAIVRSGPGDGRAHHTAADNCDNRMLRLVFHVHLPL
jgi:hypothetical protein